MTGKIKAVFLLAVMYGLGTYSGIAIQTYRSQHPSIRKVYASRRIKKLKAELHLSAAQEQALHDILDKAHERAAQVNEEVSWDLADIHRDSVQAIRQVLTPDQMRQFEKLHKKYHARHQHFPADDTENTSSTEPVTS